MRTIHHRPIRSGLALIVLFSLLANACRLFFPEQSAGPTPAPTIAVTLPASATFTQAATPSLPPSATPLPSQPPATQPPPTPTPEPTPDLRQQLQMLMSAPEWANLEFSPELAARWQEFVAGTVELSPAELLIVHNFITRWTVLTGLLDTPLPAKSHPILRLAEFTSATGDPLPILYVADDQASQSGKDGQLFLTALNSDGEAQTLLLAPPIQGLEQRPGPDVRYIYYYDDKGNWLLRADARSLDKKDAQQEALIEMLDENDVDFLYSQADIYPRFYFNLPGVPSSFYLVEKLTLNQIKLLIATFHEFDQQPFSGLKEYAFTAGDYVPFLISREDHPFAAALALPMGGNPPQGIILLYSRNLFASKYETVAGIAHEVAHIWQGRSPGCDRPQARLAREIGDGTVPADLSDWEASKIIQQSSQTHQLGAYHMSLWVAMHYKLQDAARFYRGIITTGSVNGQSIINCGS